MRRTVLTALALAAASALAAPMVAHAGSPESCTHNEYTALGHAVAGDQWHASFHVKQACTVELWTFEASGPSWPDNNPQHLFRHSTYRLPEGDHTKSIELPPCYFQADVTINGRVVDTQTGGKSECQPSTTTTSPSTTTTSTSSTSTTSTTTSTPPTTVSTPTTAPAPSATPSPTSSGTSSSTTECVVGETTSADGSPTATACELAFSGSNPVLGVVGVAVILGGSFAYLVGRRRRRRFEAELEAMK